MTHLKHRYTTSRQPPLVDAYQNITNLTAQQMMMDSGTYTIITFTRPICSNEPNDIALSENPFLLYAWGPVNNYDGNDRMGIGVHSTRGWSETRIDFICDGKVTTTTRIDAAVHAFMIIDVIRTYNRTMHIILT